MNRYPPAPKCPTHEIFMRFKSGQFPRRYYLCPCCRDHWQETGETDGRVGLTRVFREEPMALAPTSGPPAVERVPVPCYRPHIGPGTVALAGLGAFFLLRAIVRSGRRGG